jgi:hypothetical protein
MAVDQKIFGGVLNNDDREAQVTPIQHIGGTNIRFYGGQNGLTAENIKGNYLISNSNLPTGNNECVGPFYDSVKKRILFFNWNSNGNHGLYKLSIETGAVTQIFRCGVDSATDILRLSLDYPIHSMAIIYRPESDGDLLYWTDGNAEDDNRPRYLNIDTVSTLSPFTEDMINAAKNAPLVPPFVNNLGGYQNDATVNVNRLSGKLFRFCYYWGYANLEKSTLSPISSVPIPVDGFNPTIQNDPTKNNYIVVPTIAGGNDATKLGICGQQNIDNVWGDMFLIEELDMVQNNISPGAAFSYNFYNDGTYPSLDPRYADSYYDRLPDIANTLELLNGNVIIYGGITEGYNQIPREDIDVVIGAGLATGGMAYTYTSLFSVMVFITAVQPGATYQIQFTYSSGAGGDSSPKNVNYIALLGDTVQDVAVALAALLNGNNISTTLLGAGIFSIQTTTGAGTITAFTTTSTGVSVSFGNSTSCWDWSSGQRFALIYFDDRGKPIDIISYTKSTLDTTDFAVTTPDYDAFTGSSAYPIITALINHLPPQNASSFQWLRASLTPPPLYMVTCDWQADADFYYYCIQNLDYQNQKDTGFIPSYEFNKGDHVKIVGINTGGTGSVSYNSYDQQPDFEILGVVERTMTVPASTGRYLKIKRPPSFPTPGPNGFSLIKIYTPYSRQNTDRQVFFEWGQEYGFTEIMGVKYHDGELFNQTATQPASFQWVDGDMYINTRNYYPLVGSTTTLQSFFTSARYSEYFESSVNSNGRGWVLDENAARIYNPVQLRWGQAYQQDTNINNINRFYDTDYDTIDRAKGDIRRLKTRDRILRVFQDRGIGQFGVYARFIQNNDGNSELVTTSEIITTNNVQYYQGFYGLSGYSTNLCSSPVADYFNDVITGREIRLGGDGITDLGLLYKGQFTFPKQVTPYNQEVLRANGSIAKVMKYWDSFESESHTILQAGTGTGGTLPDRNYSFNETRNAFCCDNYDEDPEWAISADDVVYSFKNGQVWKRSELAPYCNFFGTQYNCSITVVFNQNIGQKKTWESIAEVANKTWVVPLAYTDTNSYGTQRQESNIVEAEFIVLEGMPSASIKRDVNSRGGKWNGDVMKGNFLVVKFQVTNASNLVFLNQLICKYIDSPLNVR